MNVENKLRGLKRRLDVPIQSICTSGVTNASSSTAASSTSTSSTPSTTSNSSSGTSNTNTSPGNGYILRKKLNSGRALAASLADQKSLMQCKSSFSSSTSSSSSSSGIPISTSHLTSSIRYNGSSVSPQTDHISWQDLSSSEIRQIVFNVSMCKLSRYRQTADPDLFKSVLICTTLKRLQRDLENEGMKINFGSTGVSFVPINGDVIPTVNEKTIAPSSSTSRIASVAPLIASEAESSTTTTENNVECTLTSDCFLLPSKFDSDDSGRLTPHPASEIELCESSSTSSSSSYSPSCSSTSSSSSSSSSSSGDVGDQSNSSYSSESVSLSSQSLSKDESVVESTLSIDAAPQLPQQEQQQRVNELFGDIDLSMYDFDIFAPLKTPPTSKVTTITAEDLIKCIDDEPVPMVACDSLNPTTACSVTSTANTNASNGNDVEILSSESSSSSSSLLSSCSSSPSPATQASSSSSSSSSASASSSPVFSKIFLSKKETIFLEDLSPAIS